MFWLALKHYTEVFSMSLYLFGFGHLILQLSLKSK